MSWGPNLEPQDTFECPNCGEEFDGEECENCGHIVEEDDGYDPDRVRDRMLDV
jgi:methionyl-tRNA synthetase